MDSPPTFDELATIDEVDNAKTVNNIIDCIREITSSTAGQDNCTRQLSPENKRRGKEEPVSFVLSIEPVLDNVRDLTPHTQNTPHIQAVPRSPKAVFVMLPNIDPGQVRDDIDDGGDGGDAVVDGFLVDNIRAEALVADNEGDDGSGGTRDHTP